MTFYVCVRYGLRCAKASEDGGCTDPEVSEGKGCPEEQEQETEEEEQSKAGHSA